MIQMSPRFIAVVAVSPTGIIGRDGDMPWRLSTDLQRFKKLTMGATILMGRKTFESIGRALPGRRNLVLSTSNPQLPEGVEVFTDLDSLINTLKSSATNTKAGNRGDEVYVIGGATIYKELLAVCDAIYLTRVFTQTEGDTTIGLDLTGFQHTYTERIPQTAKDSVPTEFQIWKR